MILVKITNEISIISFFNILKFYCSEYFKDRDGIPWVSLYVQGFADVPVSWHLQPHTFFADGDNNYVIILKPKDICISTSLHSNNKMLK